MSDVKDLVKQKMLIRMKRELKKFEQTDVEVQSVERYLQIELYRKIINFIENHG